MSEFNIIDEYFNWRQILPSVVEGIGDDAAILNVPENKSLVVSVDTSVSGVHFPENTDPYDVAWKSLAVNLSDLAAMGASAEWFTLALTLPSVETANDRQWLASFSKGLKDLSTKFGCSLVGGDTTKGPLSITIQVMGFVDNGAGLLRSGAKQGDSIYVTGTLGDAAVGLVSELAGFELQKPEDTEYCIDRLNKPTPRLRESTVIKEFASSCIDLSDGFLQDLSHVLKASTVGASIDLNLIPFSKALKSIDYQNALNFVFKGGDDYELLFTIPKEKESEFLSRMDGMSVTRVGQINGHSHVLTDEKGNELQANGYNHFS